ncbi:cell-cycle control medial ring component [Lasiosphaeria hispida]|uniref:Cell-cycle control medial ring component n=1 Tax=Lasiosphaeria hispida TaxID=260671 RepID=A0AAJ0M9H9_9PEZI|nr:cell-cycle control medial ring component [Lasiosphaeria hispida]
MATEISFAKSFLTLLDTKPSKITPDHIEDPRNYPSGTPYILPRLPSQPPLPKPRRPDTTTSTTTTAHPDPAVTSVRVRSLRNPPLDIALPALPLTTSALDVKTAVAAQVGADVGKLRLLYAKKVVADSKSLKDILAGAGGPEGGSGGEVEFSVMVMGGAAALSKKKPAPVEETAAEPVAQGLSGTGVLETEEFWGDLKGFLQQRVRDEKTAEEAVGLFRGAWAGRA